MLNIDGMSGRSGAISTKKSKNNLLAIVLILSVLSPTVQIGKTVVERCYFILSHKTMDSDNQVALTAVPCTRTLITAATSQTGHVLLRHCCGLLLSGLIEYIAKIAPLIREGGGGVLDALVVGVGEVWKAFSAIYASVPEEHRDRVLGVFLPAILLTLSNDEEAITTAGSAVSPASSIHASGIAHVLSFGALSPMAFKQAARKLYPGARESLEQAGGKPQISLRAF
ncbi:hypothetical protein AB1N83_012551 [Pleurotus pulmonarius]